MTEAPPEEAQPSAFDRVRLLAEQIKALVKDIETVVDEETEKHAPES